MAREEIPQPGRKARQAQHADAAFRAAEYPQADPATTPEHDSPAYEYDPPAYEEDSAYEYDPPDYEYDPPDYDEAPPKYDEDPSAYEYDQPDYGEDLSAYEPDPSDYEEDQPEYGDDPSSAYGAPKYEQDLSGYEYDSSEHGKAPSDYEYEPTEYGDAPSSSAYGQPDHGEAPPEYGEDTQPAFDPSYVQYLDVVYRTAEHPQNPQAKAEEESPERSPSAAGRLFRGIGRGLFAFLCIIVALIARLIRKSRVAAIVIVVVIVLVIVGLVDYENHAGKIYEGVSVGGIDVSHMTVDEAADAIASDYDERLADANILVFADEEVASTADLDHELVQYEALAEQMSFEEAQENEILWVENAESLGAYVPAEELAAEAMSVGRDGSRIRDRISAASDGRNIDVNVGFDEDAVDELALDLDDSVGDPHEDYSIAVNNGEATVVEGHDGDEVDLDWLRSQLQTCLLSGEEESSFVAEAVPTPVYIDEAEAQRTCDAVNTLISGDVDFVYNGKPLDISRTKLGSWISTRIEEGDSGYTLCPYIDDKLATSSLVSLVSRQEKGSAPVVSIDADGDDVTVTPQEEVTVPLVGDALATLDDELFGEYRRGAVEVVPSDHEIAVETQQVSGPMSFDDAYGCGIVTEVSSFTTDFVNVSSTANRAHNIDIAADLLNNSVAKADGGKWSFNDITGPREEEGGFLEAGAISDGEYVQETGGGICQVATTVFNAVFDAGYAVVQRTNHSLYVSSYPAGRDAAVSYPDLDLVWRNDSASDVLLCTSYTDTSITVTLYGVDPGYVVSSETGDWHEGDSYSTKTVVDDDLPAGSSYVETAGSDGLQITVWRTVNDEDGETLYEDEFDSVYDPVTEVIVEGGGSD